jgi:hypothetical protein
MNMLESTASLQLSIALLLEAKAAEAEKTRNWICNHLSSDSLFGHEHQMKQTGDFHDQIVEVIEGLTKMENALNRNMQALLNQGGGSGSGGEDGGSGGGLGDMFSFGGNEK